MMSEWPAARRAFDDWSWRAVTCPRCRGSGLRAGDRCLWCDASGALPTAPPREHCGERSSSAPFWFEDTLDGELDGELAERLRYLAALCPSTDDPVCHPPIEFPDIGPFRYGVRVNLPLPTGPARSLEAALPWRMLVQAFDRRVALGDRIAHLHPSPVPGEVNVLPSEPAGEENE